MIEQEIKIEKTNKNAKIPTYGTNYSAGADLYANIEENKTINPQETVLINTGIMMQIPKGYVGLIFARSSLATKKGLAPANKVGVIDSDYRGEILVPLHNESTLPQTIEKQERIAQIIIMPYLKALFKEEELNETNRGDQGFGSTGTK